MDSLSAVGACLEHPERTGTPCVRCGTFGCGACLVEGLCPRCREGKEARPPQSDDTVGFGLRAGARVIDLFFGQAAGAFGGILAAIVLAILEATGVARAGWLQRFDHGFLFNFAAGSAASLLGAALSTAICGASPGKMLLGLRTVRVDGARAGFGAGLVRELAYFIDGFFFGLVAKGVMDGSPLKQRLGDQWANTVVVYGRTLPVGISGPMFRVVLGVAAGLFVQSVVLGLFFIVAAV
jgi:uncharacterized RDD family membrane protein YckC